MNKTAKLIHRTLMALFGIMNSLLPILQQSNVAVSANFVLSVNICSTVLLFLATKPLVEQQAEIVDGIKELVSIQKPKEADTELPAMPGVAVEPAEPFDSAAPEEEEDPRGERFNAYLDADGNLEITPRV